MISVTKMETLSLLHFSEKSESTCVFYLSKKTKLCSTGDKIEESDHIDIDFLLLGTKNWFFGKCSRILLVAGLQIFPWK